VSGDYINWEVSSLGGAYDWGSYYTSGIKTGSHSEKYEIGSGPEGRMLRAYLYTSKGDTIYSNVIGPIEPAD